MSCHPIDAPVQGDEEDSTSPHVVAALMGVTAQVGNDSTGTNSLGERQRQEPHLAPAIWNQEMGHLTEDPIAARVLAANNSQYTMIEGILYHTATNASLVPPQVDRRALLDSSMFPFQITKVIPTHPCQRYVS